MLSNLENSYSNFPKTIHTNKKKEKKKKDKRKLIHKPDRICVIHSFWCFNLKCLEMELVNLPQRLFISFTTLSPSPSSSLSLPNRSFQPLSSSSTSLRRLRCCAASPNPPPPPHNTDPPPENESTQLQGKIL